MLNNRGYITPLITVFIAMIAITAVVYFAFSERAMARGVSRDSFISHEILELEERKAAMQGFALFSGYQAAYDAGQKGENDETLEKKIEERLNNFKYKKLGWDTEGNFKISVEEYREGMDSKGFIIKSITAPRISNSGEITVDSGLGINKLVDARFFLLYYFAERFGKDKDYREKLASSLTDNVKSGMYELDDIQGCSVNGPTIKCEAKKREPLDAVNEGETALKIFRNSFIELEKDSISGAGDFREIVDKECGIAIKPRRIEVDVSRSCNVDQDCYGGCYDECYGECYANGCSGHEECEYEECESWPECDKYGCWLEEECYMECDLGCVEQKCNEECEHLCNRKCNWVTWTWNVDTDMDVSLIDYSDVKSTGGENFRITVNRPIILNNNKFSPLEYRVEKLVDPFEFHYDIAIEYAEYFSCENHAGMDPIPDKSYNLPPYYQTEIAI